MAFWERIAFIWGCLLLAFGTFIAVLHLMAWAKWRIDEWLWQRRAAGKGGDGWIRPTRLGSNRNIRL